MKKRYKTELITNKEVGNKWGLIDHIKLANYLEIMLNQYDEDGYSVLKMDWLTTSSGVPYLLIVFERYDFDFE